MFTQNDGFHCTLSPRNRSKSQQGIRLHPILKKGMLFFYPLQGGHVSIAQFWWSETVVPHSGPPRAGRVGWRATGRTGAVWGLRSHRAPAVPLPNLKQITFVHWEAEGLPPFPEPADRCTWFYKLKALHLLSHLFRHFYKLVFTAARRNHLVVALINSWDICSGACGSAGGRIV